MTRVWPVPAPIRSERLDLKALSPALWDALIAGDRARARDLAEFSIPDDFPDADWIDFLRFRRGQVAQDPSWAPWSSRSVVLRATRTMVGYANFHGPPGVNDTAAPDAAEVGYTIFAPHRGLGYATEVARAMIDWAARERGVRHFISGVAPDNGPSLRVNAKLGFVDTGAIVDGERILELRLPESHAATDA